MENKVKHGICEHFAALRAQGYVLPQKAFSKHDFMKVAAIRNTKRFATFMLYYLTLCSFCAIVLMCYFAIGCGTKCNKYA